MNLSRAHKALTGVGCCDKHPQVIFEGGECPWEVPPNNMDFQDRNYKVFYHPTAECYYAIFSEAYSPKLIGVRISFRLFRFFLPKCVIC